MAKQEDRLKAIELEKQGYPKTEIAKMLNVSRQTVHEWLKEEKRKDGIKDGESDREDADDLLDQVINKYDEIATDLVKKVSNDIYGQLIEKALAKHGIFMDGCIYDRIDQYINRYDTDDLEAALDLAHKLRNMGLEPGDFTPDVEPANLRYFPVFLKFLKTPFVEETITKLVKGGISRPDAIYSVLYHDFLQWEHTEMFRDRLSQIGDAVASKIVERTSGIMNKRIRNIEDKASDRVDQVLGSFQAVITESFEKIIEGELNKLNITLNERNMLLEEIHEKLEAIMKSNGKELKPKRLIAGIGLMKVPDSS